MFGKRDDPSDRVRLGTREDRAANTMCAPHMGHSVSRHRPVAMLCSYITLCVFEIKKKLFVGANVERELERSSARSFVRSFVPRSESVNPVVRSERIVPAEELSSLTCCRVSTVVEETHAVA